MKQTTNYKLNKPDLTDIVDIEVLNTNMDTIDLELNKKSNTGHTHKKAEIIDFPTSLPANGGNADTVGGFTVKTNVPADAKFTDTIYTHPSTHPASMITGLPTSLPANGGNADTVGGFHAYQLQCLQNTDTPYSDLWMQSKWNGSFMDFYAVNSEGVSLGARVAEADTLDGKHASSFMNNTDPSSSGTFTHGTRGFGTEGNTSIVLGSSCIASSPYALAQGISTTARGTASYAGGNATEAAGYASHAEGSNTSAFGNYCHSGGYFTVANNFSSTAIGKYSANMTTGGSASNTVGDAFIIGNGNVSTKSNCFRVAYNGTVYSKGSYNTSGADYAEYFEWADGNNNDEDRRGYFVTMDGSKIKIADSTSDFILGIVSGNPCIIGNADDDWANRWLKDEFGSYILEYYDEDEIDIILDEESGEPVEVKTGKILKSYRFKENPDYDPELDYIERKDRKEWSAIGMMGVLSVRDNGKCKVNSFCTVGDGGIAIPSDTGYRVIERVKENVIKVIFK